MPSTQKTEGTDGKESGDLKISAAIANRSQPQSEPARRVLTVETAASNAIASDESPRKLPPSPLVTPPMGSNPSQAAQEAISPRNFLPADAITAAAMKAAATPAAQHHPPQQPPQAKRSPTTDDKQHHSQQRGVPHVYHDYSKLSGPGPAYIRKKTGGVTQRRYQLECKQERKGHAFYRKRAHSKSHSYFFLLSFYLYSAFPDKLHEMLFQESSDDPARAIVSWLPHGRAFIVRKPKEFTTEIMPKYVP